MHINQKICPYMDLKCNFRTGIYCITKYCYV